MALVDDRVVGFGSCGLTVDLMAFGVGRSGLVRSGFHPLTRRAVAHPVGLVVFSLIDLSRFPAYPHGGCYLLILGSWRFDLRALGLSAGSVTKSVTSHAPNSKRSVKKPAKTCLFLRVWRFRAALGG